MTTTVSEIEEMTLTITQEIRVEAPLAVTFEALLEQIGPANEHPDGTPMPFKLEAWPGGRWFRDLGDDNGHFWTQPGLGESLEVAGSGRWANSEGSRRLH